MIKSSLESDPEIHVEREEEGRKQCNCWPCFVSSSGCQTGRNHQLSVSDYLCW
ncbi:unnamed protein product, partial [Musa textilis]